MTVPCITNSCSRTLFKTPHCRDAKYRHAGGPARWAGTLPWQLPPRTSKAPLRLQVHYPAVFWHAGNCSTGMRHGKRFGAARPCNKPAHISRPFLATAYEDAEQKHSSQTNTPQEHNPQQRGPATTMRPIQGGQYVWRPTKYAMLHHISHRFGGRAACFYVRIALPPSASTCPVLCTRPGVAISHALPQCADVRAHHNPTSTSNLMQLLPSTLPTQSSSSSHGMVTLLRYGI